MRVPKEGSALGSRKGVSECGSLHDRTLRQHRDAVHELGVALQDTMPVNRRRRAVQMVHYVDHHNVTFAYLIKKY